VSGRNDVAARLLVCGNVDRCDDGAAIWAAGTLLPGLYKEGARNIDARRCGQLDIEHLLDADGAPLIIVDTAIGIAPGAVVTLTFDELVSGKRGPAPSSSHALPIDQVVGVARQLSDAPIDGLFVGIGGSGFGFGRSLSSSVRKALPEFIAAINTAIDSFDRQPTRAGGVSHVP
jgi:hydrogenase maturation protease